MSKELNISWCYPDILNLHGDRGNIMALVRVAELMGLTANVTRISNYSDKIDFKGSDLLLFNVGELKSTEHLVKALSECRAELDAYIDAGGVIVVIGTTGCAFAKKLVRLDGSTVQGLGIFDMECTERDSVYGDDLIFRLKDEDMDINGSQIDLMDVTLGSDIALGTTIYGRGNGHGEPTGGAPEGARYKNVVFTNCLGPVFVKNPWFAESLIKTAMSAKGEPVTGSVDKKEYALELASMECIKKYNKNK